MKRTKILRRLAITSLVSSAMLLQACAGAQRAVLTQKYDDPTDVCVEQRRPIIGLRSTEEQERIRSAVAAAIVSGIIVGAVSAAAGSKNWLRNGAIAAGVGLLAGYSQSYFKQKSETAQTKDQLLSSVDGDARQERTRLTKAAQAVNALRDCRDGELADIRRQIQRNEIKKADARARVLAIQERVDQDNRLISEVIDGADQRVTAYVDSTAAVSEVDSALLAADRRDAAAKAAKRKVGKKSSNVVRSVNELSEFKTAAKMQEENTNQEIQALLELTRAS